MVVLSSANTKLCIHKLPGLYSMSLWFLHHKFLQAFSVSIDGSAALLNCSANASEALVHTLQQSAPGPDSSAAIAALECLANLTRTHTGVTAALAAQLPSCLVTVVNQVCTHLLCTV